MPYTMQDFRRDYVKEHLKDLTFEEVLQGLTLEQRLDGVPLKEIEKYLQRLKKRRSHHNERTRKKNKRAICRKTLRRPVAN